MQKGFAGVNQLFFVQSIHLPVWGLTGNEVGLSFWAIYKYFFLKIHIA
jgi:hypothetical protein